MKVTPSGIVSVPFLRIGDLVPQTVYEWSKARNHFIIKVHDGYILWNGMWHFMDSKEVVDRGWDAADAGWILSDRKFTIENG